MPKSLLAHPLGKRPSDTAIRGYLRVASLVFRPTLFGNCLSLTLDEYRISQVCYARAASRLPIGSEEKRSALEQVGLTQRMIDRLRRPRGSKP
jgi:hypothetical protein